MFKIMLPMLLSRGINCLKTDCSESDLCMKAKMSKTVWQLNKHMKKKAVHSHVDVLITTAKPNLALWCMPQVPAIQEATGSF